MNFVLEMMKFALKMVTNVHTARMMCVLIELRRDEKSVLDTWLRQPDQELTDSNE